MPQRQIHDDLAILQQHGLPSQGRPESEKMDLLGVVHDWKLTTQMKVEWPPLQRLQARLRQDFQRPRFPCAARVALENADVELKRPGRWLIVSASHPAACGQKDN
jgi:hypothetical protein